MFKEPQFWAVVKSDPKAFLRMCFDELNPGKAFLDNWHIDAILYELMKCYTGNNSRLIVNLPPRHLKSLIASVVWPAYILGHDPTAKIMCVSYGESLAKELADMFRRIIESEWYRRLFPGFRVRSATAEEVTTEMGGSRLAVSVGGAITGKGADFIIIDDPHKPDDLFSDAARKKTKDWYQGTLLSRLDDKKFGVIVIVMQRLHVDDLTGFAATLEPFRQLKLGSIAQERQAIPIGNGDFYVREIGDILHPEREDAAVLERIRATLKDSWFSAQYLQAPQMPSGDFFRRETIHIVPGSAIPRVPRGNVRIFWIAVDAALSVAETADYSAIVCGWTQPSGHYVYKVLRGRWPYEALLETVLKLAGDKANDTHFVVEAAATGISLLLKLSELGYRTYSKTVRMDKVARASYVLRAFAEDRIHLVSQGGDKDRWIEPFMNELLTFPNGRHDDMVDALVYAVDQFDGMRNTVPFTEIY